MVSVEDERWMRRAVELAKKGEGWTRPNPLVGAVVVKDGILVGEGYHERCGQPHAERNALAACFREGGPDQAAGATLYVTLEPCCHHGRTPPCTEAIIAAGIKRVAVGSLDPNHQVAGKGVAILRNAGIEVEEGVLREECDLLNPVFFHYISTGLPYVAMKYAMTVDGKITGPDGETTSITGKQAREHVHRLRGRYAGIMVGIGTVLADDPLLNCRLAEGQNPVRIICDSHLRLPVNSRIARTARELPTIVAAAGAPASAAERLEALGITVLNLPGSDGRVDLHALMCQLGRREIDSVLLEGGASLNAAALRAGIVQKLYAYVAPLIFGGTGAKTPVQGPVSVHDGNGSDRERAAAFSGEGRRIGVSLSAPKPVFLGPDLLLEYEVEEDGNVHRNC